MAHDNSTLNNISWSQVSYTALHSRVLAWIPSVQGMAEPGNMDARRLSAVAADAVAAVISFHTKIDAILRDGDKRVIAEAVEEAFPLRARASDINVAHLEIACDAAVAYAENFNRNNTETQINARWMYHCVQSLLSASLKPELLLDGQVTRLAALTRPACDNHDDGDGSERFHRRAQSSESSGSGSASSSSSPGAARTHDTSNTTAATEASERASPVQVVPPIKDPKTPWTDEEIRTMIELKADGYTHKMVGERLGRVQGSVENKYGRVIKEEAWKGYDTQYRSQLRKRKAAEVWEEEKNDSGGGGGENHKGGPSGLKKPRKMARMG